MHIKHFAREAEPLYSLLNKSAVFKFNESAQKAYEYIKSAISSCLILKPPNKEKPFQLTTDASGTAIGAMLCQENEVIGFASRKLQNSEKNYSTFDKEALAIYWGITYFKHILLDSQFTVHTDHRPLLSWLSKPAISTRHARWILNLQDLSFTKHYIPGKENVIADYLSRDAESIESVNAVQYLSLIHI